MDKQTPKQEANKYDKILKENIESLLMPLLGKYLNIHIVESEKLDPKLQTTIERETDIIRIVTTTSGERFILHIEFQSQNERDMIYRIKEYDGIIQRKYKLEIRHYVIYLGSSKMNMRTQLEEWEIFSGFEALNVSELKFNELIESQIPEEVVFAILSDFRGEQPEQIIRSIIEKLKKVSTSTADLKKFISQLQVLSKLRKLDEETAKTVNIMPLVYDIEDHALFKRGVKKGIEKNKKSAIINMLKDDVPLDKIAKYQDVTIDDVIKIQQELSRE